MNESTKQPVSTEPAVLRALEHRPTNLPAQATALLGRQREIEQSRALLIDGGARLLTLVGPGGSGKTRLAVSLAAELSSEYELGPFFVDLSPIADATLVLPRIAETLKVRESSDQTLLDRVRSWIGGQSLLLVLDNVEQVVDAAGMLGELLSACPGLAIVATSREPLRLRWEQILPIPPLGLPDRDAAIERLNESPAVELFVQRARAVRPDFELTPENIRAVVEICIGLDGLPLAIELAAAHSGVLDPRAMTRLLSHPFELLRGGPRDQPARQQTLWDAVDWSYNQLSASEQTLFRRLSLFVGGSTVDTTAAVYGAGDGHVVDTATSFFGLSALAGKSLLRQQFQTDGETRFRMLETIRAYARTRLEESGEAGVTAAAFVDHFVAFAEAAEPELTGPIQASWHERLEREYDNLRAALRIARERGRIEDGLRLAGALSRFWEVRGHLHEGRAQLTELLALDAEVAPHVRVRALNAAGHLAFLQADYGAAQALQEQNLALRRGAGDGSGEAAALNSLGLVAMCRGAFDEARALFEQARVVNASCGDLAGVATNLNNLARVSLYQGDPASARSLQEESLVIRRQMGDRWGTALTLADLADVHVAQGDPDAARALLGESLALWLELGSRWGAAYVLEGLAGAAGARGAHERTVRLIGSASALRETLGEPTSPPRGKQLRVALDAARRRLGERAYDAAWGQGRREPLESVLAYARETPTEDGSPPADTSVATSILSPRETEVAALIARGMTNRQIANVLVISERTADAHVARILSKLAFASRAQVAVWASRQGWSLDRLR